jgi:hypothetical protein
MLVKTEEEETRMRLPNDNKSVLQKMLLRRTYLRLFMFVLILVIFFLSAGTLDYWEAWVYLAILSFLASFVFNYLFKNAPVLLERRMRIGEMEIRQKWVMRFSYIYFFIALLLSIR